MFLSIPVFFDFFLPQISLPVFKYKKRHLPLQISSLFSISSLFHIPSKSHTVNYFSKFLSSIHSPITTWLCPRPISNSQLHTLLHFHLCPIYLVVFKGSYFFRMGYLILRGASRLDAFSVYPVPAWLLCHAFGNTTDPPAASPPRSSRTKGSSSQISYAHAG